MSVKTQEQQAEGKQKLVCIRYSHDHHFIINK